MRLPCLTPVQSNTGSLWTLCHCAYSLAQTCASFQAVLCALAEPLTGLCPLWPCTCTHRAQRMPRASSALPRAPRQGPIDFLPSADLLVRNMERQWGEVDRYRGIATSATGARLGARGRSPVSTLWMHPGRLRSAQEGHT